MYYQSCSIFQESDCSLKTCGRVVSEGGESYVYGRGALDVKLALFGILEALEHSVKKGIRPKRTFYLAFGHDEEVGGSNGAKHLR